MRNQIIKLLQSNLSSNYIGKQSGVEQSTIHRLRTRERTLDNLGLKQCELLYTFSKEYFKK